MHRKKQQQKTCPFYMQNIFSLSRSQKRGLLVVANHTMSSHPSPPLHSNPVVTCPVAILSVPVSTMPLFSCTPAFVCPSHAKFPPSSLLPSLAWLSSAACYLSKIRPPLEEQDSHTHTHTYTHTCIHTYIRVTIKNQKPTVALLSLSNLFYLLKCIHPTL
jgi:hypothetical protein